MLTTATTTKMWKCIIIFVMSLISQEDVEKKKAVFSPNTDLA